MQCVHFSGGSAGCAKGSERTDSLFARLPLTFGSHSPSQRACSGPPECTSRMPGEAFTWKIIARNDCDTINKDSSPEKHTSSSVTPQLVEILPSISSSPAAGRPGDDMQKLSAKQHFIIGHAASISGKQLATLRLKWKNCHFEGFVSLDTSTRSRNLYKKRHNLYLNTKLQTRSGGAQGEG